MIVVLGVLVLDHASSATFIGSSLVGIGIKLKEVRDLVAVLREVCGRKITYLTLSPSPYP